MSKYSSLMDYLDAQDPDCSRKESKQRPLPPQYRNSSSESAISSKPASPPGYSSRRQYVWDEVESSRPQNRFTDDGTSSSASSGRTKASANRGDDNQSSSQDGTSVGEMIQAVRSKVDAMKIELRNRCDSVRELQTELARVRNAKERREDKFKKLWESRLSDLTEEQNKMIKRQTDFLDKLAVDTKTLFEKDGALREKIRIGESNSASTMLRISQDGQRKKERTRNQCISDERVSFEKVLASKMESMKTQAAKSMGLRLDATVSEYRETALRASEDVDNKLVQLKSALQAELQMKNAEAIQKLRDERAEDDDRQKRLEERKLEEARRRQESEILTLKEKFTRNRNVLEEKHERTRRDESSSARSGVLRAREEGSRQLREASEAHQRALAALLRSNTEAKVSQERELREQADQWECAYRKEAKDNQAIMRKRARDLVTAKTAAETEKIIQRLRSETEEERNKTRKALEKEAEDIRSQAQLAVDVVRSTESRSSEQLAGLRADVTSLKQQLGPLGQEDAQLMRECSEGRKQLVVLRAELRDVEAKTAAAESALKGTLGLLIEEDSTGGDDRVRDLKAENARKAAARACNLKEAEASHEDELYRIRQKVGVLLERKSLAISELRTELQNLQAETLHLEDQLEALRLAEH